MSPTGDAGGSTLDPFLTLTERVWYRSKAIFYNIFEPSYPETSSSRPYAGELPHELLDMIIGHVPPDTPSLKACSRTCRSWYIATLPHLRHTLTLCRISKNKARGGLVPLQKLDEMRLLSCVKRLRIIHCVSPPPEIFNAKGLDYFSALTNVQELGFDELDLHSFNPKAQMYLGHFIPRLRYLALRKPRGTYRQLLYFLGLFPNLDDFKLTHDRCWKSSPPLPVPVVQPAPSLRGRLTLTAFHGEELLRDLSKLCGGLRFYHMDLVGAEGSRLLLDTCAETLETLRVHPAQWHRIGNRDVILRAFGLSNSRSLRTLEIEITLTNTDSCGYGMRFLGELLSTVTSPVFSDVVILLRDDINNTHFLRYSLFSAVRDMSEVRPFRLVFRLGKLPLDGEGNRERLKGLIEAEVAKGGLGPLPRPPVIVPYTRVAWTVESTDHLLAAAAL